MRRLRSNSSIRRSAHRAPLLGVLAVVAAVAGACGGGSSGAESGDSTSGAERARVRTPVRMAPQGANVVVGFESEPAPTSTEDLPRTSVTCVLSDDAGGTTRVAVDEFVGSCGAVDPVAGDLLTYQCWFAGGGVKLHTGMDGTDLVVRREELDEQTAEDPSSALEILRFGLAEGASVHAAP